MVRVCQRATALGLLGGLLVLLGGCASPDSTSRGPAPAPVLASEPAAPAPAIPAPAAPEPPATILGFEEPSTMLDSFTVFVAAVDGTPVARGRDGWKTKLPLVPGLRRLTVVFTRGVFTAQAELRLQVQPAAAYQLRFATDAQLFGRNSYCDFWVVDAVSGQSALPPTRAPLNRVAKAD